MSALKSILWCLVCLLSFPALPVQALEGGPRAIGTSEVPFKLVHDFLVVIPGRIGDLSGLKFILDTGSTHSTVNRKLARKLGVPLHRKQVFDFARFVQIESAVFSEVELGPIQLTNVSMLVGDLAHVSDFADDADALIGSDLLSLNNFAIDYDARKVFFDPVERPVSSTSPHPVGMIVELQLQDRPVDVLVDTGVEGIVLFEDRLRSRIPQLRIEGETDAINVRGRSWARQAILPMKIRLGTRAIDARVLVVKGPPANVLPGVDGYLGTASLKATRIDFNFKTGTLSWK